MSWFRLDDSFYDHPKVIRAGNAAVGLWVRCGTYSARYLLDGTVPNDVARRHGRTGEVDRLLAARLWVPTEEGFLMPDYLEYNPSAEQVLADRAAARDRQRRAREAARDRRNGHS